MGILAYLLQHIYNHHSTQLQIYMIKLIKVTYSRTPQELKRADNLRIYKTRHFFQQQKITQKRGAINLTHKVSIKFVDHNNCHNFFTFTLQWTGTEICPMKTRKRLSTRLVTFLKTTVSTPVKTVKICTYMATIYSHVIPKHVQASTYNFG